MVVPLAKLQILKQNTNHQNSHNNESFDSGTGGTGNSSSGHVTPSSPSFSSPSHPFGPKLKWGPNSGPPSTTRSITSPSVPILVDASTQTQNPITSKPTMVSRWTQTTNITPTNVRLTRRPGPTKASISNGVQVNNAQQRPSLHHYLLSEKRFARGRHTNQLSMDPDPNEALYDQVYGSNTQGLIYGNGNEFYDIVANEQCGTQMTSRDGFYDDVYDDEYFDEYDEEFDENSSDEEDFEDFDADDEFGGESIDESEEDEDEEDEECDFEESTDGEESVDGQLQRQIHRRQPPPGQRQTDELELYSAQGDFGEFVRGHSHRQALPSSVRSSIKISNNNNNNIVTSNNGQQSSNQMNQNDGIRMSASFTSVDFKRNIAGRRFVSDCVRVIIQCLTNDVYRFVVVTIHRCSININSSSNISNHNNQTIHLPTWLIINNHIRILSILAHCEVVLDEWSIRTFKQIVHRRDLRTLPIVLVCLIKNRLVRL